MASSRPETRPLPLRAGFFFLPDARLGRTVTPGHLFFSGPLFFRAIYSSESFLFFWARYFIEAGSRSFGSQSTISGRRIIVSRIASMGRRMITTSRNTCTTFKFAIEEEIKRQRP